MIECYHDFLCPLSQVIVLGYMSFLRHCKLLKVGCVLRFLLAMPDATLKFAENQQKQCDRFFSEYYSYPYQFTSVPYLSIHSFTWSLEFTLPMEQRQLLKHIIKLRNLIECL